MNVGVLCELRNSPCENWNDRAFDFPLAASFLSLVFVRLSLLCALTALIR